MIVLLFRLLFIPAIRQVPGTGVVVLVLGVMFAAWAGGRGAGLIATGLVVFVCFGPNPSKEHLLRLALFGATGTVISQSIGALDEARRRAEAAAERRRKSDERHRRLVETGLIGVAYLDQAGRITEANDEFLRLIGRTRGELVERGLHWSTSTPAEFQEQDRRMLQSLREGGRFRPFVKELVRGDGSRASVVVGATRLEESEGAPGESVSFVLDISARRRAEDAVRLLAEAGELFGGPLDAELNLAAVARLTVPRLADLCVVDLIDPDGGVRRVAVATSDPARQATAQALANHPPDRDGPSPVSCVLRTGRSVFRPEVEAAMYSEVTREGEHRDAVTQLEITSAMSVPMIARERVLGALSFAVIGGARRFDGEDLAVAEELARRAAQAVENSRLFAEAQQARVEAENASRAKDQFLAALSHELRTPLTPVLVGVSAALDEPGLSPNVRSILEITRRNVALEARLIEDLLDVTRITQGKLRLDRSPVDVHELVSQAVAICRAEVAASGLRLDIDLVARASHVEGDPARLQQVIWNLVKNAVKFTPPHGRLAIRSRNEPDGARALPWLVLEVIDSGIGIAPEVLPRIFNAFEQADPSVTRTDRRARHGMGLAISRIASRRRYGGAASPAQSLLTPARVAVPPSGSISPSSPRPLRRPSRRNRFRRRRVRCETTGRFGSCSWKTTQIRSR